MILPIKHYGDPVLRKKAATVTDFGPALQKLARDMAETMYSAPGIGLAAPQVGIGIRFITVDVSHGEFKDRLYQAVNPEVLETSAETECLDEGCLSVPEFFEPVVRPRFARFRYQNLQGEEQTLEAEGLLARCFLHEIDHLNGVLFVDRMVLFRRKLLRVRLKKHFGAVSLPEPSAVL